MGEEGVGRWNLISKLKFEFCTRGLADFLSFKENTNLKKKDKHFNDVGK